MHWTHEQIIDLLKAATPFAIALNTIIATIAAWQATRAKAHAAEASAKVDTATAKVDEVHACLAESREETRAGVQGIIRQAATVAAEQKETTK